MWLLGLSDGGVDLDALIGEVNEPGAPRLLLTHSPDIPLVQRAVEENIPLVLAGHTHGGQVRLPVIGAVWVPGQPFPPRYVAGLYRVHKTHLYVNRGLGTSVLPVRFPARPEVTLIQLVRDP